MKSAMLVICLLVGTAYAEPTYRIDVERKPMENGWATTYVIYEGGVTCVAGRVAVSNEVHVSAQFDILYKGEVAARTMRTSDAGDPQITLINNARKGKAEYCGVKFTWIRLWDRIARRVPLPGEGPYVVDPDGHVRIPKPEELLAIWRAERESAPRDQRRE